MKNNDFISLRKRLDKTQEQLARLLGNSVKAVRSYEQGWRLIPAHVERQLLFLVTQKTKNGKTSKPCWDINKCPVEKRNQCPAWEFNAGEFCWHINGTICDGVIHDTWQDKINVCKTCDVLRSLL